MTSFASSSRWLRLAVLAGALLAAVARPGHAEPAREFRQHYEAALRFYDSGQFEGAIKEFQAAYALKQLPRLLLNIGQAHRKLGHARDALGFYEFYLRVEPNPKPEIKAELTTYIAQTRSLLEAAERMRSEQKGEPAAGAEQTPAPAGAGSGGPGSPAQPATAATASPAAVAATAAPAPAASPPTAADTRLQVSSAAVPEHRTADSAAARPVYKKWWFWTIIGVGVAATATGIALGVRASASSDPSNIEIRNVF